MKNIYWIQPQINKTKNARAPKKKYFNSNIKKKENKSESMHIKVSFIINNSYMTITITHPCKFNTLHANNEDSEFL